MDLFLDWVQTHRAESSYDTRRLYCSRFGAHKVGPRKVCVRDLPADGVRGEDLESWLAKLKEDGLEPQTRLHAETSVRHCWSWATEHPSPPYLPRAFRPFSAVERTHVPLRVLTEGDLMTAGEVQALFAAAGLATAQFRRHGAARALERVGLAGLRRTDGQVGSFADLLRCYHATGARTGELAACRVGDVLFRTRQVLLGVHKRSRTQKSPTTRQVTLNEEALAVFTRHCEGKAPTDSVFLNSAGRPWNTRALAKRLDRVKDLAAELKLGLVRDEITIYDFRHLWISDALTVEGNIAKVARMAGTSVSMIEKVYGHFRNQDMHDTQARLDELRRQRQGQ
jgi:integrase